MEEIKVGEYVRTKKGKIGEITSITISKYYKTVYHFKKSSFCFATEIKKHSFELIDLIEVRRLCK